MRNLSTLILLLIFGNYVWGQSASKLRTRIVDKQTLTQFVNIAPSLHNEKLDRTSTSNITSDFSQDPVGTRYTSDAVTVIKIGEASNPFTTLNPSCPPLAALNGIGTNGTVAFLYRQNIVQCDPLGEAATVNNGILRYSISTDGGASWDTGDQLPCFGIGPITPVYQNPIRFPMAQLYAPEGSQNVEDLKMVAIGSILTQLNGEWDGAAAVTLNDPAGNLSIDQEDYLFQGSFRDVNGGLTQRVAGEFWYVALESVSNSAPADNGLGRVHIYKGLLDEVSGQIDWQLSSIISPDHFVAPGAGSTGPDYTTPNIAFSPDGQIGYVTFLGDLNTGVNGAYSPVIISSQDAGASWSEPLELDMRDYTDLSDSLTLAFLDSVLDDNGNFVEFDTVIVTPQPTTGFSHDLVVDAEGNPHILALVGAGTNQLNDTATYSIFPGFPKITVDFTFDEFGDLNLLFLSRQATFRGEFPADATEEEQIAVDMHPQISRNPSGSKIFYTWTDTDTTGGLTTDNIAPNLFSRVLDLDSDLLSTTFSWTEDDQTFGGLILLPKIPEIILENEGSFTLPTVFTNLDGATALDPASFFYVTDIVVPSTTAFTEEKNFFFNCKASPFENTFNITEPNCGTTDGSIEIVAGGGSGGFNFQWDANADSATTATIDNLSAGIYSVVVSDDAGCTDEIQIVLDNIDAPVLALDSTNTIDIACFGDDNGQITVNATGGTPGYQFSIDGENFATSNQFTGLDEGLYEVVVRDTNNCESVLQVEIEEPDSFSLALSSTNIRCTGEGNGSIVARAFGGTGEIAFAWTTGDTTPELLNLEAGEYSVTITDENECTSTATASIVEPGPLTVTATASAPNNSEAPPFTGVAVVQGNGGTPNAGSNPYDVLWSDGSTQSFNTGLCGDTYTVTLTDANGCTAIDSAIIEGIACVVDTVTSIEDELAAGIFGWEVFPNPGIDRITMVLNLEAPQRIRINLSDAQGRSIIEEEVNAGLEYKREYSLTGISAGVYLLQITTSEGMASRKILIK